MGNCTSTHLDGKVHRSTRSSEATESAGSVTAGGIGMIRSRRANPLERLDDGNHATRPVAGSTAGNTSTSQPIPAVFTEGNAVEGEAAKTKQAVSEWLNSPVQRVQITEFVPASASSSSTSSSFGGRLRHHRRSISEADSM